MSLSPFIPSLTDELLRIQGIELEKQSNANVLRGIRMARMLGLADEKKQEGRTIKENVRRLGTGEPFVGG